MLTAPNLRDRLPSIVVVLGLHAGLAALLLLSFEFVRRLPQEKETILVLPPLFRPKPAMVIDGRKAPPPRATPEAAPPPVPPLPAPFAPPGPDTAILRGLDGLIGGSRRPGQGIARRDPRDITPPDAKLKDEGYWAAEREANQTPPRVPCVSLESTAVGMGPIQGKEYSARISVLCALGELANWGNSDKPQFNPPAVDTGHAHAGEAAFQQALAAVQARQNAIYGKTARAAP